MAHEGKYHDVIGAFFAYHSLIRHTLFTEAVGLTKTQAMLLATIDELGSVNMTTLAKRLAVSKEQASRSVQPLVEAGLVERLRDDANRRHVYVEITAQGIQRLRDHACAMDGKIEADLAALSDEECQQLIEASRVASGLLSKALGCNPKPTDIGPSGRFDAVGLCKPDEGLA